MQRKWLAVVRNDGVGGSSLSCDTNQIKRLAQIAQFPEPAGVTLAVNKSAAESAQKSREMVPGRLTTRPPRSATNRSAPDARVRYGSYPLAASADREIGLQFLNICLIAQRLCRRWSPGSIGLLPDLGLLCWARPNGQRLACLLVVFDTYGKAIGTGFP